MQRLAFSFQDAHIGWGVLFLKAIPANAMVCMAVMLGLASRDSAGKIMALWFPVVMFVLCGFEHCVANSECTQFLLNITIAH
jgi:formate/nitrite transporter FocA (FNT family)